MSYINNGRIDEGALISSVMNSINMNIPNGEDPKSFFAREMLNQDSNNLGISGTPQERFIKILYYQIKRAIPREEDSIFRKRRGEAHLSDEGTKESKGMYIDNSRGNGLVEIGVSGEYVAAVHDIYRLRHKPPTRAGFVHDVALEVSQMYGRPYNMFYHIDNGNVHIVIDLNHVGFKYDNTYSQIQEGTYNLREQINEYDMVDFGYPESDIEDVENNNDDLDIFKLFKNL